LGLLSAVSSFFSSSPTLTCQSSPASDYRWSDYRLSEGRTGQIGQRNPPFTIERRPRISATI
jgi:hypothetical protein